MMDIITNYVKQKIQKSVLTNSDSNLEIKSFNKRYIKYKGPPRLYCTHCGHKIQKPQVQVSYMITCNKCDRPLDLPSKYYTK
jgi:hypothetical protein